MAANDDVALVQTLCTSTGPGSAELADWWASNFGMNDVAVWGDTQDYLFANFSAQTGGGYPNSIIVDLDTMEILSVSGGGPTALEGTINGFLSDEPHPCAE